MKSNKAEHVCVHTHIPVAKQSDVQPSTCLSGLWCLPYQCQSVSAQLNLPLKRSFCSYGYKTVCQG